MIGKWLKMHGCPDKGRVVYDKDGATGIAYGLPGEAAEVVLYIIEGHGLTPLAGREIGTSRAIGGREHRQTQGNRRHLGVLPGAPLPDKADAQQDALADADKPRR